MRQFLKQFFNDESGATAIEYCIIAAGTLITEGTRIPAGSLVMGSPGKVKRPLNDAELAEIRRLSQAYVGYRLDYMNSAKS